jgi:hypothetical protein
MKTKLLLVLPALGLLTLGTAGGSVAMPAASLEQGQSGIVPVYHRGRPHRPRVRVYPDYGYPDGYDPYPYNYVPDYSYYYPPVRGFGDYSNVYRGNMRGCSVDLGYGRYESCDK